MTELPYGIAIHGCSTCHSLKGVPRTAEDEGKGRACSRRFPGFQDAFHPLARKSPCVNVKCVVRKSGITSTKARTEKHDLAKYRAKRDFSSTPEPRPKVAKAKKSDLFFCVQKHQASRLHYDFRLEHKGVLLSWSVPKGPSLNPRDKRMAIHVEDHPLDYGTFEGVIPSGYGAGVVALWDRGTWTPENGDVSAALNKGELKFSLDGVKLKGSWVLVRTKGFGGSDSWLLIKHKDEWSGDIDIVVEAPLSVKTFGDHADILRTAGIPPAWEKAPPIRTGETGARFRELIAAAKQIPVKTVKRTKTTQRAMTVKKVYSPNSAPAVPALDIDFGRKHPTFTNPQRVLYPATGFTKGDLVRYYTGMADVILPHLKGRAITLKRYPEGVDGKFFFEKRCNKHRPDWVKTVVVPGETAKDKTLEFCLIEDVSTLGWIANLAAIELHVPLALAKDPGTPTSMVFDLDPGEGVTMADICTTAIKMRGLLKQIGLASWAKHSGGKGIHLYVPLNSKGVTFDDTKVFSKAVAVAMEKNDPAHMVSKMSRAARPGKIYIDWAQNDRDKTTVGVFSVRARERQTVSWPLTWRAIEKGNVQPVLADDAKRRIKETVDFDAVLTTKQKLPQSI